MHCWLTHCSPKTLKRLGHGVSYYSYIHSGRPGLSANTFQPPTLSELRENSCSSSQQQLHNESSCHQQQLPNSEPVSPNRSNLPFGSMMGQPDKFSTIKRSYRSPFRRPSGGSTSSEMAFVSTGKQKHSIRQNTDLRTSFITRFLDGYSWHT